ncbi:MAG: family 20 glycosylhydrolase [Planctomycetes bacterium]|nr:family 20 glycosylhydrolase [Planctomycetota bacterium]
MRKALVLFCCLVALALSCEPEEGGGSREAILFDFEKGSEGWAGNPWKGGKCLFEISEDARFGTQALRGWYDGTPKKDGGNIISPFLPEDAKWRKQNWGAISLWVKGDGSASGIRFILEDDGKKYNTFSKGIPLDSKKWQRFSFPLRTFWNRGKRKIHVAGFKRLYFGGTPKQSFTVDRIAFEAPHYEVPLEADKKAKLPFETPDVLEYGPGQYGIRLIPLEIPPEPTAEVKLVLRTKEGARAEKKFKAVLGAGRDEVTLPMALKIKKDTTVTLDVSARGASGKEYSARYPFPAFVRRPMPKKPYLGICPLPKEMRPRDGTFAITAKTKIIANASKSRELAYCLDILRAELKKWYGLDLATATDSGRTDAIVLQLTDVDLPKEGYGLSVTKERATILAKEPRGLYYGIQTLLQAIADSTEVASRPQVKCVEIRDWPSLSVRSARIGLPTDKWGWPHDPTVNVDDFTAFLYNTMARLKQNTLILEMGHGYRFESVPKIGAKHAWGRKELEKIRDFCKRHFIEIIPCVNSMGHTSWFLLGHPELRWHDDLNMLCTCNPKSYELMTKVYDELIDIFKPRTFHIGMDEVRWRGGRNPKKIKPCGCDKVPTWEQYGRWVKKLHAHLKKRGVRTMMWGDMLLDGHNGGPPFFTKRAIKDIPRDVIIANWSSSVAPRSDFTLNKECGFTVIEANSSGVNVVNSPYVIGNMFGVWNKTPWLSQRDKPGSQNYTYLGILQGGEFSWNLNRSDKDVSKRRAVEYLRSREGSLLKQLAMQPELRAGRDMQPINIAGGERVNVTGINFRILSESKCIRLTAGKQSTVPFSGKAATLYFLHCDELPAGGKKMKSFWDRWKKIENIYGIPLGRYEMVYDDDSVVSLPIKHSWNILPRRMVRTLPYAYRVVGTLHLPGDSAEESNALYVAQWVNPRPEKTIKEIRMIAGDTEATICLFAITAKSVSVE